MKAIIGTAGHIDHGKTVLVHALTGIDTDRLPEEQRRGISIELGFAWMELPGGDRVGVVDVPGHERFVRQMLAGAQGFDLLLLVVAADDGVMPQTEEHFEICHLLDVRRAIFVITKCDLVEEARVRAVREEIEILAAGTRFENAPVIPVSAQTGRGMEMLRDSIVGALVDLERPSQLGPFRMPVDRAFVIKGHGVVVTGTASGGSVAAGDDVAILPSGVPARVREVQVHDVQVERAFAGQRTAINLVGIDRESITRGDTIVAAGVCAETDRFDARLEIRPSAGKPVVSHERVRVYLGTSEVRGRIVWLDGVAAVEPRSSAYAQLVLRDRAVAFGGDRFVLRDETASRTLGGGIVIVARARRHPSAEGAVAPLLRALESGTPAERVVAFVRSVPTLGAETGHVAVELGMSAEDVMQLAEPSGDVIVLADGTGTALLTARERFERYRREVVNAVQLHHARQPNLPGIELERLRQLGTFELEPRLFRLIVDGMVGEGALARRGSTVAVPGHAVSMSEAGEVLAGKVVALIRQAGTMPPTIKQLEEMTGASARSLAEVVAVLVERGAMVRVSSELAFAREVIEDVERKLRELLQREREITAAGFRDLISASRKYSIPLLDYFDRSGVTIRTGDYRRLRSG